MAADNTLVQASFKEAISRAGADVLNQKPLYDSVNTIGKSVFDVANLFMTGYAKEKETQRIGKDKQMAGFQTQADELIAGLYAQDEPLPDAFIMAFRDKITSLQDEFEDYNTIGKGDTQENSMARARIMGELTRVKNQAINFRTKTQIFLEGFKDVNKGLVNGKDIAGQQQALDFNNYGGENGLVATGKVKVIYGDNGIEITSKDYEKVVTGGFGALTDGDNEGFQRKETVGGETVVTLESLNKNFPPINKEHHAKILEDFNTILKQGTGDGKLGEKNYNEEIQLNRLIKSVSDPKNFKNVVSSSIEGVSDISFKESLQSNLQIPVAVLDNMFYDENGERVDVGFAFKDLDRVGDDGVINEKDKEGLSGYELDMFNNNVDALIDALTNVDNKAFDINLSSKMLGEYLNQNTKKRYDYNYDLAVKAGINNGATGSQIIYGNANIGEKSFVLQDDILDKAMKNETIYNWGGERFDPDPENPGNYIQEGTDVSKPIDGLLRGKHFGMNERINSRKLEYPTGLPNVNTEVVEEEVPLITSDMKITNQNYQVKSQKNIINSMISNVYKDYPGFQFLPGGEDELIIIAPDGKTKTSIKMDRTGSSNNAKTQKAIQQFIIDNQVK
tara:strand:- start:128 stop:1981 length:1854 start_codon:yes stop_codon:yes gene_type:complete